MIAPLFGRKSTSPSFAFLLLASLFVGILLIGNNNLVAAEERTLEESSGSSNNDNGGDDSPVESCIKATEALIGEDSDAAALSLDEDIGTYENSVELLMTDEDWSFGFSADSVEDFRDACDNYNDVRYNLQGGDEESSEPFVIFKELDGNLTMTCDMPEMKVTGKTVTFYGIADCFANTENCRGISSMELAENFWESVGLDCRATSEEGSDEDGKDEDEKEEEEGSEDESNSVMEEGDPAEENAEGDNSEGQEQTASEELTPGDNDDSNERLPFLTDEDMACFDATDDFVSGNAGLTSAIETYDSTQVSKTEENGIETIGYPMEAAMAMKSACELNQGHWAFVEKKSFTCVIEGMETISVHVHHYGVCLDRNDDCLQMDTTNLLRAELVDMGYNCWEDEDQDEESTAASSGDGIVDTESGQESESAGDVEENSSNTQGDTENETDESSYDDAGDDAADIAELLGLSESDQQCMGDSEAMVMQYPTLQSADEEYEQSMEVNTKSMTEMTIGYPDESVEEFKSICTSSDIGGYFVLIESQQLECTMMSVDIKMDLTNIADCLADTPECRDMDILLMMEDLFEAMGITCEEKGGADEEDADSSTANTSNADSNDTDHEMDNHQTGDDSSPSNELGMTDSDIACLTASTDFLDSSETLATATMDYGKSVIMTDPTKLGYDTSSSSEMEKVCEEEGGFWSFIESQDVTCVIQGHDRCINVYNFGNCLANNDDCQSMDPMVLVETFFIDVLHFSCTPGCDTTGPAPSPTSPSNKYPGDHSPSNYGLSSEQNEGSSSSIQFELPTFVVPVLVLFALVAVSFFVVKWVRARRMNARVEQRRTYEMTEISDLGFKVFT